MFKLSNELKIKMIGSYSAQKEKGDRKTENMKQISLLS